MKRKILAVILSLSLVFSSGIFSSISNNKKATNISAAETEKWSLVWSDEFDGTSLNSNNWNVEVNGYGGWNNELQYYCDSPDNIKVSDGTLKLIALKKQYEGKEYTSARLNTQNKVTVHHGKVEARIKLPCFMGAFPAFWMMGSNGLTWPKCGEIDIMEAVNKESIIYGTAHWACDYTDNEEGYDSNGSSTRDAGINIDITEWHTYGIEWTENKIMWYVDDTYYHSVDITSEKQMEELAIRHYILLNFTVGGDWPGFNIDDSALPATMEVDYVRAYEVNDDYVEPPTIVVEDDIVASHKGSWSTNVASWGGAYGNMTSTQTPSEGFNANLTAVGSDMWAVSAMLSNLNYTAGNTYTFKCTLTSNINKNVLVKVEGDNAAELAAEYVSLTANVPYTYEKTVFIPNTYTGSVSLYYAFGGGCNGESLSSSTSANVTVKDVSFTAKTTIIDPGYTDETTTPEEITTEAIINEPTLVINGYQISTTNEGFRTIYSVNDPDKQVVSSGLVYGLKDIPDNELVVGSLNDTVFYYESTNAGRFSTEMDDAAGTSYAMTMRFIKNVDFFKTKFNVRAYAKLVDGSYIYSDVVSCTVYDLADYLYSNNGMSTIDRHNYLYDNILHFVNESYENIEFDVTNTIYKN